MLHMSEGNAARNAAEHAIGHAISRHMRVAAAVALAIGTCTATAQEFPQKTIRFVVPTSPGGASDILARAMAQKMSDAFGRTVIVDNRPGGGTMIGTDIVAKAPPDGHTIVQVTTNFVINPAIVKEIPYDSVKDFAPVALLAASPLVMTVHPSVPARFVKDFIALAKAKPEQLNFASSGTGTASHLAGVLMSSISGIRMTHIPYKGSSPALIDLVSGQVQTMFISTPSVLHYLRNGRLRGLAMTSAERSSLLPELPTLSESGLPGYEVTQTFGILTTARTPLPVVTKLNTELNRALKARDVMDNLRTEGAEAVGGAPEVYADYIRREIPKWIKVIRQAGIKVE
jgi:tripartite-type tricarboxylate transporter receptor subunit TctC